MVAGHACAIDVIGYFGVARFEVAPVFDGHLEIYGFPGRGRFGRPRDFTDSQVRRGHRYRGRIGIVGFAGLQDAIVDVEDHPDGGLTGFGLELALYLPEPPVWGYWMFLFHVAVAMELVLLAPFIKFAHAIYRPLALFFLSLSAKEA